MIVQNVSEILTLSTTRRHARSTDWPMTPKGTIKCSALSGEVAVFIGLNSNWVHTIPGWIVQICTLQSRLPPV